MELSLTTPALLFPAIAILMLGYVNRYQSTANLIRTFKKDYDANYIHTEVVLQLEVLKRRIELSRHMLTMGAIALFLACLSMFLLFTQFQQAGKIVFGLSLLVMIASVLISLYETSLSNKSLFVEIHDIFDKEMKKGKR